MNIDPNTLSIILNIVSSGIYSLMAVSAKKAGEFTLTNISQEQWELDHAALQPLLKDAISTIAEDVVWEEPLIKEEIIGSFLYSPEVEEIVRQVYSTKILKGKVQGNFSAIRKIFLAQFIQYIESYPVNKTLEEVYLEKYANYLLDALIKGCELVLAHAIDSEILSAHEAQSAFRHNLLASEIEAIQKKLDFLVTQ